MRAKLFKDRTALRTWRDEPEGEDGAIELAIFSGPDAYWRALNYADRQYGDFEQVWLEP
jgi:hypothetical protein